MMPLLQLPFFWTATFVCVGACELPQFNATVQASYAIQPGAREVEVEAVLGSPLQQRDPRTGLAATLFGSRPRRWIYGTQINLQNVIWDDSPFPNPIPIKLRLFDAAPSDLVVNWTDAGLVESIQRPELSVPARN